MSMSFNRVLSLSFLLMLFAGAASALMYNVTLDTPIDNANLSNHVTVTGLTASDAVTKQVNLTVNWTARADGDEVLNKAELWANFTGSWALNVSNSSTLAAVNVSQGNFGSPSVAGIPEGYYVWAVNVSNVTGPHKFSGNYTLVVDFTPPTYVAVSGGTNNTNVSLDYFFVDYTIADTRTSPSRCVFTSQTTGANLSDIALFGSACQKNYTSLADGLYNYTLNVNDSANNFNKSGMIFYRIDTTAPTSLALDGSTAVNNSNRSIAYVFLNYTFSDINPANCTVLHGNGTTELMNLTANATGGYCSYNDSVAFTVSGQTRNYTVTVTDGASSSVAAGMYYANFDNTTPSGLGAISPTLANNSYMTSTTVAVNFTFVEAAAANCTIAFTYGNGTTSTLATSLTTNATGGFCNSTINNAFSASGQTANYTVTVTDLASNALTSGRFFLNFDNTTPSGLGAISPTLANNSYMTSTTVAVNFTFVEAAAANCTIAFTYGNGTTSTLATSLTTNATGGYCNASVSEAFSVSGQTANYTVTVTDLASNAATSDRYSLNFDNTTPSGLGAISPTNANNSKLGTYTLTTNFTFVDAAPANCTIAFTYGNGTTSTLATSLTTNATGGFCNSTINNAFSASGQTANYTVTVTDLASNALTSGRFFLNFDNTSPNALNVLSPVANSNISSANVLVNMTFTEADPDTCTAEVNATDEAGGNGLVQNLTLTRVSLGGSNYYCELSAPADNGTYSARIYINDTTGNLNQTDSMNFVVDTAVPSALTRVSPTLSNNSYSRTVGLNINFTFTEMMPGNCTLEFTHGNGTSYNYSMTLTGNATPITGGQARTNNVCNRTVSDAFSNYFQSATYRVWFTDGASNYNRTDVFNNTLDNVTPTMFSIVNPTLANNSNTSDPDIDVNVTFMAEPNLDTCTLQIFTTISPEGINNTMTKSGNTNCFTTTSGFVSDGLRNYTIWVNDTAGNQNSTGPYFVRVDQTAPTGVGAISPTLASQSNASVNTLTINYTFADVNPASCTLEFRHANNTQYNYTMTLTANASGGNCNRTMTGLASGIVNYTVYVTDGAGNPGYSSLRNIRVDTTIPNALSFVTPSVNNSNTSSVNVSVNLSFNATAPANCTLQYNNGSGNTNYSMTLVGSGSSAYCSYTVTNNFTATGQQSNFTVFMSTGAGLTNATDLWTVRFDNVTPTVTLNSPADSSALTSAPTFNFTYSDALTYGVCSLYVDDALIVATSSNITGTSTLTPTGISTGSPHTWLMSCRDDAGNVGNSSTRLFSVSASSGGSVTATPAPTAAPAPAASPDTSRSVPPIVGGGSSEPAPAPVEQTQSLGTSSEVSGTFTDTSSEFTVSYTAPASGFLGLATFRLPLDYVDYVNGLVTITPEPTSVSPGSIIATWDVALAPEESFVATVEVAKKLEPAVLKEFKAPTLNAKQPVATARPTTAATATPAATAVPTPAAADNTLWYAVGAIVLLGLLYYFVVGSKPKHKGL